MARWFDAAQVQAFASSHTCLPVFQALPGGRAIYNNGAAGMPNFSGDPAGLLTRFALAPPAATALAGASRFGTVQHGVYVDALAIEADASETQRRFLALWPPGSDAHASYFERILRGPDYRRADALRVEG